MAMLERKVMKRPLDEARADYETASPLRRVEAGAPPFLVVQGSSDNLVPAEEARAFVERLRAVSRSTVAYAEIPFAHHAFDAFATVRTAHVVAGVEAFLTAVHSQFRASAARTGRPSPTP
jgi:acetyl esterase/lipase